MKNVERVFLEDGDEIWKCCSSESASLDGYCIIHAQICVYSNTNVPFRKTEKIVGLLQWQ